MLFRKTCPGLCDLMKLPDDVTKKEPYFYLQGRGSARIENYRKILHYTEDRILLSGFHGRIEVSGSGMTIESYDKDEMVILGVINKVEFLSK